jgi:intergrase/recombinase
MKTKHELAQEIVKILIESGLPLDQQLKVLQMVKEKIEFCRNTANEMRQTKLF